MSSDIQMLPTPAVTLARGSHEGALVLRERDTLSASELALVEDLIYRYGDSPDSYLAIEPYGDYLMEASGRFGVALNRQGKYWHVQGALLSAPEEKPRALKEILAFAERQKAMLAFYSVTETDLPLFREHGFEISKFGEEPVVDLPDLNWRGKAYEWVRRQSNYSLRNNIEVLEVKIECESADRWEWIKSQLYEILQDDLEHRVFPAELRHLEGKLLPDHLFRRRLFVARQKGDEKLQAFLIANPAQGGAEWGFEAYRKRQDATRGIIPHMMRTVMDQMREEGVERVSLCLIPGRNIATQDSPRGHVLVRMLLDLWYRRLNFLFNVRGQEHFKSRFRPRMRNRYICVSTKSSLRSIFSFLRIVGATSSISPGNLLQTVRQCIGLPRRSR